MKVSPADAKKFDNLIKSRVATWEENTIVERHIEIESADFENYLMYLQNRFDITKESFEKLLAIKYMKASDSLINYFKLNPDGTSGGYGFIVALKIAGKISIALAVYQIKVEFKFKRTVSYITIFGFPLLTGEIIEDFYKGVSYSPNQLENIQSNYIRAKAMNSFLEEGMVEKVSYVESIEEVK